MSYPSHCRTVEDATDYIKKVFFHPDLRVERFTVNVVTPKGGTMKLTWDRKDVGQKPKTEIEITDENHPRDEAFEAVAAARLRQN